MRIQPIVIMIIIKNFAKMKQLFLLFLMLMALKGFSQSDNQNEIKLLLQKQTECWNNGDIEGFMQTYWKSDSLMFIGKTGVTYGWQNTLDNYKKSYPDKAAMGILKFTIIKTEQLSPKIFNVVGKWHLTRTAGDLEGHYTLLLKKINGRWLIIQDHSS